MMLIEGNIIVVFGSASTREGEKTKVRGDDLTLLESAPREFPLSLRIRVDEEMPEALPEKLLEEFEKYSGKSDLVFHYKRNGRQVTFKSRKFKIDPSLKLLERLRELVGIQNVTLTRG